MYNRWCFCNNFYLVCVTTYIYILYVWQIVWAPCSAEQSYARNRAHGNRACVHYYPVISYSHCTPKQSRRCSCIPAHMLRRLTGTHDDLVNKLQIIQKNTSCSSSSNIGRLQKISTNKRQAKYSIIKAMQIIALSRASWK